MLANVRAFRSLAMSYLGVVGGGSSPLYIYIYISTYTTYHDGSITLISPNENLSVCVFGCVGVYAV